MPDVIHRKQMERGPIKRRVVRSGIDGAGPADKTLVIRFDGDLTALAGFAGRSLDIAEFRKSCALAKDGLHKSAPAALGGLTR